MLALEENPPAHKQLKFEPCEENTKHSIQRKLDSQDDAWTSKSNHQDEEDKPNLVTNDSLILLKHSSKALLFGPWDYSALGVDVTVSTSSTLL